MFRGPAARNDLNARGLRILIPACSRRRHPATHNRTRHKKRCRIENDFACLKNWRGLAMRCTAAATCSSPPSRWRLSSSIGYESGPFCI